jgi:hypothetical protein
MLKFSGIDNKERLTEVRFIRVILSVQDNV